MGGRHRKGCMLDLLGTVVLVVAAAVVAACALIR
jgi:hypothetical protein